ncbi:MAG TPA: hypothetical protein VN026_13575 [Bacteroidia bacterium]|jgi:hypothetical protein|nr:hypothetical protein [Bacteroidia bacterium]
MEFTKKHIYYGLGAFTLLCLGAYAWNTRLPKSSEIKVSADGTIEDDRKSDCPNETYSTSSFGGHGGHHGGRINPWFGWGGYYPYYPVWQDNASVCGYVDKFGNYKPVICGAYGSNVDLAGL